MSSRKLAFLFPGQGSQAPGMGAPLLDDAQVAELCRRCSTEVDLRRLLTEADEEELRLTQNAQPALCFMGIALTHLLRRSGFEPAAAAGHSVGEYAALAAGGAISPEEAIYAVVHRGRAMAEAVPAGQTSMAAVLGLAPEAIASALDALGECWPSNYNTPTQTVFGGSLSALEKAAGLLTSAGPPKVIPLIPVAANLTGSPYPVGANFAEILERQLKSPVRWSDCVRSLSELGATDFLEVGPGRALRGMLKELAPGSGAHPAGSPGDISKLGGLIQ
ncbi:MAG: ACP S-malonyltransferase [Chloroflexi bacterium]|nr:MAG: ACP S-malonyltransferase [Chloroflexota bacterium]